MKAVYNLETEETSFRFTVNVIQLSIIELTNDEKDMLAVHSRNDSLRGTAPSVTGFGDIGVG